MSKSISFEYKDADGKDKVIIIKKPGHLQLTDANLYAAGIFNKARQNGICVRSKIDDWLEEQGIWTKKDRETLVSLEDSINERLLSLESGKNSDGTKMKMSEARKLAIDVRVDRWKLNLLQMQRRAYDEYTVEGQTENARFDYLCSLCLLDEEGNRLFKSIDEYYESADEPHISQAASKLMNLMFGAEDWEKNLPENQFLTKYGLIDNNGRLVNKQGQFIDKDGNVITEEQATEVVGEPEFEDDIS